MGKQTRLTGKIGRVGPDAAYCWLSGDDGKKYYAHFSEFVHPNFMVARSEVEFTPSPAREEEHHDNALQVVVTKLYRAPVQVAA